jgi:hypothetical protein
VDDKGLSNTTPGERDMGRHERRCETFETVHIHCHLRVARNVGEWKYFLHDFLNSALDIGGMSVSNPGRSSPGKCYRYLVVAGWALGPVLTL